MKKHQVHKIKLQRTIVDTICRKEMMIGINLLLWFQKRSWVFDKENVFFKKFFTVPTKSNTAENMPIYIPTTVLPSIQPLLIKCGRIYQYRSGIHRMSHNGHCVIRTMQKNCCDWFHWNGDGWCHIARKKRIAGTALDFYARRSRNCVVEHAQLGYLQKMHIYRTQVRS